MKVQALLARSWGNSKNSAQKRGAKLRRAVASVALGLMLASAARADLFWDSDGATAGGSGTAVAPGTWGIDPFWSTSSAGDLETGPWIDGENAFFSAGTDVTGAYTVTVNGVQTLGTLNIQEGTVTLSGGGLLLNGGVISAATTTNISSIISGSAGLNKLAAGTLTLSGANTYSGITHIGNTVTTATGAGIIVAANSSALGTSEVTFAPGTTANAYTGRLYLTGGITLANNITVTNGSATSAGPGQLDNLSGDNVLTGNISIAGGTQNLGSGLATIGVQSGTLTHTGIIQNGAGPAFGFAKVGPGTLVLSGDSPNTFTGIARVFGGYLIAEKDGAFGAGIGGVFMLSASGISTASSFGYQTVGLRAPASSPAGFDYSIAETGLGGMSLAGFSNDLLGEGLFHNFSGDNRYAGSVMLGNVTQTYTVPTPIGVASGSSLTVTGAVTNPVATPPNTSLRNLTKIGSGKLVLQGANTHIGTVFVQNGTLVYGGPSFNGGTWSPSGPAPSFMQVGPAGKLVFDNQEFVNTNRFFKTVETDPAIPVNIDGGNFELIGNTGADVIQGTIGAGLFAIGDASVTVTNPTGSTFTTSLGIAAADPIPAVNGVNRSNRGTVLLRGTNLGTAATGVSQVFLDTVPVGAVGGTGPQTPIIPFATGDASGAATGPTGFVTYGANGVRHLEATEYSAGITSGSSALVNASVSSNQPIAANTTVNSIRTVGDVNIVNAPGVKLTVNSGAILTTGSATEIQGGTVEFGANEGVITNVGALRITSVLSGTNGVTKSGRGTLTLAADNTFTGGFTVNGGNVIFNAPAQLGAGGVVLNGGYLKPTGSLTLESTRPITTGSMFTGFDVAAAETLTVAGDIGGPGSLTKVGAGTLVLTGNNSYRMGLNLNEGVVSVSADAQLGTTDLQGSTGIITFNGGTLRVTEDLTMNTSRGFYYSSNNGRIDVAEGKTFTAQAYASGPGGLIKSGKGTLVLGGVVATGNYLGNNQITDGTLAYSSTLGLNVLGPVVMPGYWTISNGATLQMLVSSAATTGFSQSQRGITLVGSGKIDIPGGILWNVNQVMTGTGTFTKTGDGELRLAVNNTYNGKTTVAGGTLSFNADGRLGTLITAPDAITLNNGAISNFGTTSFTLNANRGITLAAAGGAIRVVGATTLTYNGVISGAGGLTKGDAGTLILGGTSTYTGLTTVEAGILRVNGSLAGGGNLTVKGGATLQGTGSILSTVSTEASGHIAPGVTVGTLTVNGLSLDTAELDFEGNATGFDLINVTGADQFTLANISRFNLSDLGGVTAGEYALIDYAGAPLSDINGLTLSSPMLGSFNVSLFHDTANTQVKLRVGEGGPPQWNVDSDGLWSVGSNWTTLVEPNGPTDVANFFGKITAPRTVTLDGDKLVQAVNFDNVNTYTIAPAAAQTLTVGSGGISIVNGTHVISAKVSLSEDAQLNVASGTTLRLEGGLDIATGKTINTSSDGTVTIAGAQAHGAGSKLRVGRGKVNLNSNAGAAASAAAAATANLAVEISNGGAASTVVLGSHQHLKELSVNYADADLQGLDLASPATTGGHNAVRVYAADLDATKTALWGAIRNHLTSPGDGIYDSALHASSAIGIAIVPDEHGDRNVMVRSTRVGDTNLDGTVSISDFLDLASNFNTVGTATWQEGDMNYDQSVTISDFLDLASNFNGTYTGGAAAISADDRQLLASFASSVGVDPAIIGSAVPEPATLSLVAIGALGLMGRRRRK